MRLPLLISHNDFTDRDREHIIRLSDVWEKVEKENNKWQTQLSGQLEFSCSFLDRPLFIDLVTYKVIAWHCPTNQAARWPVANENDKGNLSSPPLCWWWPNLPSFPFPHLSSFHKWHFCRGISSKSNIFLKYLSIFRQMFQNVSETSRNAKEES